MLSFLSRWLQHRRRRRAAVDAALRHFLTTTGNKPHEGGVIGEKNGNLVVRVCFGTDVKPPHRAWYLVKPDGPIVSELSFEEAQRFGERVWR